MSRVHKEILAHPANRGLLEMVVKGRRVRKVIPEYLMSLVHKGRRETKGQKVEVRRGHREILDPPEIPATSLDRRETKVRKARREIKDLRGLRDNYAIQPHNPDA